MVSLGISSSLTPSWFIDCVKRDVGYDSIYFWNDMLIGNEG